MKTMFELQENDVDGAMEVYARERAEGTWKPERSAMLLQMQDDPTELKRRMREHDERTDSLR